MKGWDGIPAPRIFHGISEGMVSAGAGRLNLTHYINNLEGDPGLSASLGPPHCEQVAGTKSPRAS